jgi:hypothetical protein
MRAPSARNYGGWRSRRWNVGQGGRPAPSGIQRDGAARRCNTRTGATQPLLPGVCAEQEWLCVVESRASGSSGAGEDVGWRD